MVGLYGNKSISGLPGIANTKNSVLRIFFIHGFGEDETIFNKIAPFIPHEHIFLNVWKLLGDSKREDITVLTFAEEIVQKYYIVGNDVIIGHSMGGWIAYHIKHITGSPIVQIASFTDPDRIGSPIKNVNLLFWLVRKGLLFNSFTKWLFTNKDFKRNPSKKIFQNTFDRLRFGNKENVINQLRINFMPVKEKLSVMPDLRIHALEDKIVYCPREPFHEVAGDHFMLYTHPEIVYPPINFFLKKCIGSI
jgi:pimeloyl-ACP methyl ester carboxylesterase